MKQQHDNTPLLEATRASRYFTRSAGFLSRKKPFAAVHDVSLKVTEGHTLGIIGESGCGKSTLGKMLAGLLPPSEGEITIRDTAIYAATPRGGLGSLPPAVCKTVQMIFQDPNASLNPRMRIGKSVGEPLQCLYPEISSAERAQKVKAMLAEVGIAPEYADRYPHAFSGGQRQRIAIARALIANPSVIICDEPTSSLDSSVQAQVLNLLDLSQKRHNVAYVFISHDLAVVRHMSDEVAVMYNGNIVEQGPVEAVFANPAHPYTRLLLDSVPSLSTFNKTTPVPNATDATQENPDSSYRVSNSSNTPSDHAQPSTDSTNEEANRGCPFAPRCPRVMEYCRTHFPELKSLQGQASPSSRSALSAPLPTGSSHLVRCFLAHGANPGMELA